MLISFNNIYSGILYTVLPAEKNIITIYFLLVGRFYCIYKVGQPPKNLLPQGLPLSAGERTPQPLSLLLFLHFFLPLLEDSAELSLVGLSFIY